MRTGWDRHGQSGKHRIYFSSSMRESLELGFPEHSDTYWVQLKCLGLFCVSEVMTYKQLTPLGQLGFGWDSSSCVCHWWHTVCHWLHTVCHWLHTVCYWLHTVCHWWHTVTVLICMKSICAFFFSPVHKQAMHINLFKEGMKVEITYLRKWVAWSWFSM